MNVTRSLSWKSTGLVTAVALGFCIGLQPNATYAQTQTGTVQPLEDFQTRDNRDPFSSSGGSGVTPGLYQILHKAIQNNGLSEEELTSNNDKNLNDAAAAFRARQQSVLQQTQQPGSSSSSPVANP
jgi:hypothetical protein